MLQFRQHRLAADGALAEPDESSAADRQVGVHPGAEPDQPVGVTGQHRRTLDGVADDPPGDQPGDLGDDDLAADGRLDHQRVALVVLRCLVQVGGQEGARRGRRSR